MPSEIITPKDKVTTRYTALRKNVEEKFALFEDQGPTRKNQQDAMAWHTLEEANIRSLTPEQIGQRL